LIYLTSIEQGFYFLKLFLLLACILIIYSETWTEPKGGVRVGYDQNYSHQTSRDTPYFVAAGGDRAKRQGDQNPTTRTLMKKRASVSMERAKIRKSNIMKAAGASANAKSSWANRNVMGGCYGRVTLKERNDYASAVQNI
jgi:hypothetical protein